jgi:ATP-binding cassette subfamily F protein 3
MGGSTKKWMLRSASEELREVFFPAMSGVGWEGDEDACQALCLRAVSKGGFRKAKPAPAAAAATAEPAAPPEGLEAIWAAIQTLSSSDFAAFNGEIGELIVERGLGSRRYFPPGSTGPGHEPEPEPGSAASTLSAQLMRDAAIQARKAKQARAAQLAQAKAEPASSAGTSPLSAAQTLLGVKLEDDIFEYVEGTANGLSDDVKDGNTEKDDAIEELFAVLGPMLEEAGADEEALESNEAALKALCGQMVSPPDPAGAAAATDDASGSNDDEIPEATAVEPLEAAQTLLGVKLEDDIREYIDGTANGLPDDVKDGNTEKDDAIEELFAVLGPMLEEAGADEEALESNEAALKALCGQMVSPPAAVAEKKAAAPKKLSLREQMEANKVEEWRVTGVNQTNFAMDGVGLTAQEALRAKEREAQKKDLTPAQIAARKRKEDKEQQIRDKHEQDKMLALLAKKNEKCTFSVEKVEAGDGPGAMNVTGLQFKYDTGGDLLRNSNLLIHANRRYGLIGRNGEGKSSLLRILPEFAPPGTRIHVVHQEAEGSDTVSALEAVIAADEDRTRLLTEEAELEASGKDLKRLAAIGDELNAIDAYSAESRAASILAGLQFTDEMQAGPTSRLSGGWRMRLALATALFRKPELLCLDEPTNHLDLYACLWLEEYLSEWPTTLLCVAHDVTFLNEVCTDIIHLCNQSLTTYAGNFDAFEKQRAEVMLDWERRYKKQQEDLVHYKEFVAKWKDNRFGNNAGMVESRLRSIERMETSALDDDMGLKIEMPPSMMGKPRFFFPAPASKIADPLIGIKNVAFGYVPEHPLFHDLTLRVNNGDRIGIVGRNGAGKSTLLKLLVEELKPCNTGIVTRKSKLGVSMFSQHHVDQLELSRTPLGEERDRIESNRTTAGAACPLPTMFLSRTSLTSTVLARAELDRSDFGCAH